MAALAIDYRRHVRRPIGFVVFGLVLMSAAGYLTYDILKRRDVSQPSAKAYSYTVKQSIDKNIKYFPSSFYSDGPGKNAAYVMDLTDKIKTTYRYTFTGSTDQQLAYAYDIRAVVRGKYALKGNEENTADVWTKEFQLLAPVHGAANTKDLSFSPSVDVPYDEYRKLIDQVRNSLVLPVASELVVTFTVNVSGVIEGTPFNDLRVATVTAPFGEQIYVVGQKYDKEETKRVVPVAAQTDVDRQAQYETYAVFALGALSLASLVYGFRRQIFKTPYQRELDKIYRYHDGIIIRASRLVDLAGKRIVPLKSFDDMLNLEEELKLPIVAASLSAEATRFMIIRDDVAYVYVLGKMPQVDNSRSLESIASTVNGHKSLQKPRKIQ